MNKSYYLECMGERLTIPFQKGESAKSALLREFGWLLNPLIEKTKTFENALQKLNWKLIEKYD